MGTHMKELIPGLVLLASLGLLKDRLHFLLLLDNLCRHFVLIVCLQATRLVSHTVDAAPKMS